GTRKRIIDEMGPLQMYSVVAEIPEFQRGLVSQALLHREAPLLNVLRRSMRVHGRKADGGFAQHWSPEIKPVDGWSEIVTLLGFRKHIRNIVALVAPGIHVNG